MMKHTKKLRIKLIISDVDGVIANSELAHYKSWKKAIGTLKSTWSKYASTDFEPLTPRLYRLYIDGQTREKGLSDYLLASGASKLIEDRQKNTFLDVLLKKNSIFLSNLNRRNIKAYPDVPSVLKACKQHQIKLVALSSSRNCRAILETTHLSQYFDLIFDGNRKAELNLHNKSEMCASICKTFQLDHNETMLIEDSLSGVYQGAKAALAYIVAINRRNEIEEQEYLNKGADIVLNDLTKIGIWIRKGNVKGEFNVLT